MEVGRADAEAVALGGRGARRPPLAVAHPAPELDVRHDGGEPGADRQDHGEEAGQAGAETGEAHAQDGEPEDDQG